MPSNYGSFKFVQEAFAHCYFDAPNAEKKFGKIIKNERDRFYRYNFFFANYLIRKGKHEEAEAEQQQQPTPTTTTNNHSKNKKKKRKLVLHQPPAGLEPATLRLRV